MRRLTALIKAIVPFPPEIREEFFKIVKVLDLAPGEWVPDDLPTGTSIFVEDGLLLLTQCEKRKWRCSNIYIEGTLAVTYSEGATEMKDGSFRVRAVEPTRIYYMTREEERRVHEVFPSYNIVRHVLRQRSFFKSEQRRSLFKVPSGNRIMMVDTYFRNLMRVPTADLAEFLGLETAKQREVLATFQKLRTSPHKEVS